ncbi:MAG: hypothetical protein ACI8QC_000895 [Planctomycetota bacterium]|jgi:hypothetical protein
MNAIRREGWAQLDGLLAGDLAEGDESYTRVEAWVRSCSAEGLRFLLHRDGGRFSILADDEPVAVGADALEPRLSKALRELLQLGQLGAGQWESTLRLRQWSAGEEAQVLWVPDGEGALQSLDRRVDCETHRGGGGGQATWKKASLVLLGLGLFVVLSLVQGGYLLASHWSALRLDAGVYEQHVRLQVREERLYVEVLSQPNQLREALLAAQPGSQEAFLLEDLLRGHLRYRFLDAQGQALPGTWVDVALNEGGAVIDQAPPRRAAALVLEL